MEPPTQTILVVDDQPINVRLLQRRFERDNMTVTTATNGKECLESVSENKPDIILLDVMMPEMDGIEACKKLKNNPETSDIPVIFITARNSQEGKLQGLRLGAADYITKPIDLEETAARVHTQLNIQHAHRENLALQQRLNDVRRAAAIGSISQGVSHNLNNLLGVVVGYMDLLKQRKDDPEFVTRGIDALEGAINRMIKLIRELSRVASQEKVPTTSSNISQLIDSSILRVQETQEDAIGIIVERSFDSQFDFRTNPESFETIIINVLNNAVESCANILNKPEVKLTMDTRKISSKQYLRIRIKDNGCGVHVDIQETLFEPFVSTHTDVGRGLGLASARHAAHMLRGEIKIESNTGEAGSTATIILPFLDPAEVNGDNKALS